ncbi:MAG: lipoyl synthase [Gammaproteobacteria bacterium]|nr:lipoyl synthase [Gammaproteobacteria bacterium]
MPKPSVIQGVKQTGKNKVSGIPIKVEINTKMLRKPSWIRAKAPSGNGVSKIKKTLRDNNLFSVCEEASCPNLGECFSKGTATFMIMGDICTRRCPFCDVAHGRPNSLDTDEPKKLASTIAQMALKYVVITSVDRDDLRDGGAEHFADCIKAIREESPNTKIEILVPDFRGRMDIALETLSKTPADVFNHNLESVPSLYKKIRPGSDYLWSLKLLQRFKAMNPSVPTKSGLMLGLGETKEEVVQVLKDMREHDLNMLTLGQYLQPTRDHLAVERYVTPDEFKEYEKIALELGFDQAACGPMVRSSYHADIQAEKML